MGLLELYSDESTWTKYAGSAEWIRAVGRMEERKS